MWRTRGLVERKTKVNVIPNGLIGAGGKGGISRDER
jgi:hypothetical protein